MLLYALSFSHYHYQSTPCDLIIRNSYGSSFSNCIEENKCRHKCFLEPINNSKRNKLLNYFDLLYQLSVHNSEPALAYSTHHGHEPSYLVISIHIVTIIPLITFKFILFADLTNDQMHQCS